MNDKLDKCCNRLKEEIMTAEASLAQAGKYLASAVGTKVEDLEARRKEVVAMCDSKREHAASASQRIRQCLEEAKDELVSKLEDWKTDREIAKIEKEADKKEQQAVDAIAVAAFALLEAEVAIVKALKARKIAVEVAG